MNWLNSFRKRPSGITSLTCAIIDASYKCGQEFKESIDERFGNNTKEASSHWLLVVYEYLFFFIHLADRSAFSKLGSKKRSKLMDVLAPVIESMTTEAWFASWPAEFKCGIKKDFFNNLNNASIEYSQYKKLFAEKGENLKDTLFWELGKNIARLSGYEHNPVIIMQAVLNSSDKFANMKLDYLIESAGKEM
ncbi:MAG: hypothetical protein HQK99_12395 [Nitrospirae bacterium]|nr:hypothetical protein [Nitrospirota bacterium]